MKIPDFLDLRGDFLLEAEERVAHLEELLLQCEHQEDDKWGPILDEARRELHTLKGNAGMMGLDDLQSAAHILEDSLELLHGSGQIQPILDLLDTVKSSLAALNDHNDRETQPEGQDAAAEQAATRAPGGVRVPFPVLDELVDLLAEMVIFRNRLADAVSRGGSGASDRQPWDSVEQAQEALGKTLSFIQDKVMALRMVPLRTLFGSLRRTVHDEAQRRGKLVRLQTVGGETPMDKALLEVASVALGHFVRNAIAHGLESPDKRKDVGKSQEGLVRLNASANANEVLIDVIDDGKGIDRSMLATRAAEQGLSYGTQDDLLDLLFLPGFSTSSVVDLGAGRGIGLSAAAEAVKRAGGRITVASEPGRGARFTIHLPLSVSIARALLLQVDGEEYALPLSSVIETIRFAPGDGHRINDAGVFTWRDKVLPLIDLGFVNGTAPSPRDRGFVVVVEADDRRRGVVVGQITGIREIVVKALDAIVGVPEGIAGATILGDGRVVLILDPRGLVALDPHLHSGRRPREAGMPSGTAAIEEASQEVVS